MEQIQIIANEWQHLKEKMKHELMGIKQSFVWIGYALRQIEDKKLYEQDGYKSVTEFAKAEYGLTATIVSRFKAINEVYSVGGYSEQLKPEYKDFKRSQLEEMLTLTEADRSMIQPGTSRSAIRELKQFNRQAQPDEATDDIYKLIEEFFRNQKNELNQIFAEAMDIKHLKEIVNPSGNKSFRRGLYFMMMYDDKIQIKKFGDTPQTISWEDFYSILTEIFEDHGNQTWQEYFGEEPEAEIEPAQETEKPQEQKIIPKQELGSIQEPDEQEVFEVEPEKELDSLPMPGETKETEVLNEETEIEPAQNSDVVEVPEQELEEPEVIEVEILPKPFGSRIEYLNVLKPHEAAIYLQNEYKAERLTNTLLLSSAEILEWLLQDVDSKGNMIINAC